MSALETLKQMAAKQVEMYPQYQGYFDNYVLVKVKKEVKTKFGLSFTKDEIALANPEVVSTPNFLNGKTNQTIVVWSMKNQIGTHLKVNVVEFI